MTASPALDLSGTWRAHMGDGDLHQRFFEPAFDDTRWNTLTVPGHWRSDSAFADCDGPVLHRRSFEVQTAATRRQFLTFDGVFYFSDAWLDGEYLGATEGYFFPNTFEVTDQLNARSEHTLAVEVACPPQRDRTHKRLITGIFSHWDTLDRTWNPGGIWRPVRILETGPVRVSRLRCLCTEAHADHGRLLLDLTLDAGIEPAPAPMPVTLRARVSGPDGALLCETTRDAMLANGDNHLQWTIDVDEPPRWWPRRLGAQPLCGVELTVEVGHEVSDTRTVRTAFREVRVRNWTFTINDERLFVMGSNHGPTRMALAEATEAELHADVQLALDANLDLLRMHAHVTRPELYDAADEQGLLLWQDFPLQWGYGRGLRKQATRQAREMVDLLGHHPSVVLWCGHNEPLAIDLDPGEALTPKKVARVGVAMFLPSWNKDVLDRSIARSLHKADPTRPVDRFSGVLPGIGSAGTDTHFYFGWYHGQLDGLAPALRAMPRLARFVTEFGAQAVPNSDEFMDAPAWPKLDWDRLFQRHALQKLYFDQHVPPDAYATYEEWRMATQEYQAWLTQLQVEDLRRIRHDPTGGFCQFCFADGGPLVSWSVLDHRRVPKLGYGALRDACRPVLPMLDPRDGSVHVVNETRDLMSEARVSVDSEVGHWKFGGNVGADGVTFIGTVRLPSSGDVQVAIEHPLVGRIENRYPAGLLTAVRDSRSRRGQR